MKKVLTKDQRFALNMAKKGFLRKKFWIHADDYDQVKAFVDKLKKQRLGND